MIEIGDGYELREVSSSDVEEVNFLLQDPSHLALQRKAPLIPLGVVEKLCLANGKIGDSVSFFVLSKEGKVLGVLASERWLRVPGREHVAEIHITLSKDVRGTGIAEKAIRSFCSYLFSLEGVEKIVGIFLAENRRCLGLAEKAGFQVEGVLLKNARGYDGKLHDEVGVCLLK